MKKQLQRTIQASIQGLQLRKTLSCSLARECLAKPILLVFGCGLLVYFLWWHGKFAVMRYFDVDEFAHLHWTSHMLMDKRPYLDFLTFFPPGFLWFLAPMFTFGWGTTTPILAARLAMFAVFVGIVGATGLLFWEMRRSWIAVVAALVLAFLPLPFDKFVEIRPDNPATLLLLIGLIGQIRWIRWGRPRDGFLAGLSYGASVVVLTKMLPVVLPGMILAFLEGKTRRFFFFGFGLPLLLVGMWLLTLGDPGTVWYSLTRLPLEANKISNIFFMAPDLFFYPNGYYFGTNGWSRELLTNHALWIVGLFVGTYRLLTPFLTGKSGKLGELWWREELLVAGTFLFQVLLYVQFIPLKHAQYLIPIAPFVAFYVADAVDMMWQKMKQSLIGLAAWSGGFLVAGVFLVQVFLAANNPKLMPSNADSLNALKKLYETVPFTEPILDLDGRTLYYPDSYYVCCLPFGQFAPFLSRPLPPLIEVLENTRTTYIYQGQLERINTLLPEDQEYIRKHFRPSVAGQPELLVRYQ